MMVSAVSVCNSILKRSFDEKIDITPMKMQKLLYFVYKEYLKQTDCPLFEERFEAWKYGPVIDSVYQYLKKYKYNSIKNYVICGGQTTAYIVKEEPGSIFSRVLDEIWNKYKTFDGIYLSKLTHSKDTAWYFAAQNKKLYLEDIHIKQEVDYSV